MSKKSSTSSSKGDYAMAKPSRIKLKQTPDDLASKIYRAEQARQCRLSERVSRANASNAPPPTFPPPHSSHRQRRGEDEDDTLPMNRKRKYDGRWPTHNPMYPDEEVRVPSRYAKQAPTAYQSAALSASELLYGDGIPSQRPKVRRPEDDIMLQGGPIPSMGKMNIEQYLAWIRAGMDKLRRQDDSLLKDERAREQAKLERERDAARENERKERESRERKERRKWEKAEAERKAAEEEMGVREEDKRKRNIWVKEEKDEGKLGERKRYMTRWKAYSGTGEAGAEVVEVELAFDDIPWPIYRPRGGYGALEIDMLTKEGIGAFLYDLARDAGATQTTMASVLKKGYREAILRFHPDKFYGKILARVRESDIDLVKEGVEKCSRAINELNSDRNA